MNLQDLDFAVEAQLYAPIESGDVYFYSMDNRNINTRKKCTDDFETWVSPYNHSDTVTIIITGAAPVGNAEDYTLLSHIENFVKLPPEQPVLLVPVPEDAQPE
jgi:hypothetical protein